MIGDLTDLGPWAPGEHARYEPCPTHSSTLARLDFEDAWEAAANCEAGCVADYRGRA